jgi:hypothetical protein
LKKQEERMKLLCLATAIVMLTLAPAAATAASTTPSGAPSVPSSGSATDPTALRSQYESEIGRLKAKISQAEAAISRDKKRILELQSMIKRLPK